MHGLEQAIGVKLNDQGIVTGTRALVRFADDFLVFCQSKEDCLQVQNLVSDWLENNPGLKLSQEKTKIVHLSEGFDYLGFNIRQYKSSQTKTGWKLLTKPSRKSVQRIKQKLRLEFLKYKGQEVNVLMGRINPIIRGWANYFRSGVSSEIFAKLDQYLYVRQMRYVKRMHPNQGMKWKVNKYWGRLNPERRDYWVFGDKQTGRFMLKFSWFSIQRHKLVPRRYSPDDPDLQEYWQQREKSKAKHEHRKSYQKILTKQKCLCPICRQSLFNGEDYEIHHRKPKLEGGKDTYNNLMLVHRLCHQQIHFAH